MAPRHPALTEDDRHLLMQEYLDVSRNMRSYGEERFRNLTLFSAAMAGTAAPLVIEQVKAGIGAGVEKALLLSAVGLALSAYFAFMDKRSADHWDQFLGRARRIEDRLPLVRQRREHDTPTARIRWLGKVPRGRTWRDLNATNATALLAILFGVGWWVHAWWALSTASFPFWPGVILVGAIPLAFGIVATRLLIEFPSDKSRPLARPSPPELADVARVFDGAPWVQVSVGTLTPPAGRPIESFYLVAMPKYVVVVAMMRDGKIAMERAYKAAVEGQLSLECPMGALEGDETPLACGVRELEEETKIVAEPRNWKHLGTFVVDGNHGCGEASLFLVRDAEQLGTPEPDPSEPLTVVFLSLDELVAAVERGEVKSLPTIAALSRAGLLPRSA